MSTLTVTRHDPTVGEHSALPPRFPGLTAGLTGLALVVGLIPSSSAALQFDRAAIAAGEWWRIITGHWTHGAVDHLLWDALVFAVLGSFCELRSRRAFVLCVVHSALAISLALAVLMPEVESYRGLSGIDTALFMLLAVRVIRTGLRERSPGSLPSLSVVTSVALVLMLLVKTGYELAMRSTVFVDSAASGLVPVPLAHVVGAVIGAAVAVTSSR